MTSAAAALAALALSATSTSELGLVVKGDDPTSRALLAACPRLVVFPLADAPGSALAGSLAAAYRASCPGGQVVAQVGGEGQAVEPGTAAVRWASVWLPLVLGVGPVAGVEGPWDAVATPDVLVSFWSAFAVAVNGSGYLPIVGASAPGLRTPVPAPSGGSEDGFCPVARAVAAAVPRWAWSYRALSPTLAQDASVEATTSLGYRAIASSCQLRADPLFVTTVRPSSRGWQAGDVGWLAWLDGQLAADAAQLELRGAAVGEAGAGGPFDLAPIAADLAAYLAHPQPPDGGSPDGGAADGGAADGGTSGGIVQPSPAPGGPLVTSPPKGCSCGSPVLGLGALLGVLLARLRRRAQGVKR